MQKIEFGENIYIQHAYTTQSDCIKKTSFFLMISGERDL